MEIVGYAASLFVGISLGLIGAGGSILTVPMMVYLFGLQPLLATSYSLFIVGSTSLVGTFKNIHNGWVSFRSAILFGATSIITVFLTRQFIIPALPQTISTVGNFSITTSDLTMVLFAILMLLASINMIIDRKDRTDEANSTHDIKIGKLLSYGVAIGLITGLLGAGGGFILIPALVILLKLPMKKAIGTSLMIVALNSLVGFAGDLGHFQMDWIFLLKITSIAITGIFIGSALGKKIPGAKLKKAFGWFVLAMSLIILLAEIVIN